MQQSYGVQQFGRGRGRGRGIHPQGFPSQPFIPFNVAAVPPPPMQQAVGGLPSLMMPPMQQPQQMFPIPRGPPSMMTPQPLPVYSMGAGIPSEFLPEADEDPATSSGTVGPIRNTKLHLRKAGGQVWSDATLEEWPDGDFRVFCGDLGNEVTDELLSNAFRHFKSFQKARVIRDRRTGKGKGFGFVSFANPEDMLRAMKDMDRKYVGNRPIRVTKSKWREREQDRRCGSQDPSSTHTTTNDTPRGIPFVGVSKFFFKTENLLKELVHR
ncbi:RNA-binding protein 42-like [Condylostylus longicornis]|uniref:RNA-binding protein 42-like n=1 Tax=Condylostylus longicornis TaxID=2530218 RepID=UPI00244E3CA3|nr:RNA-binding protein 42-like [Condylostylus longicornis]